MTSCLYVTFLNTVQAWGTLPVQELDFCRGQGSAVSIATTFLSD